MIYLVTINFNVLEKRYESLNNAEKFTDEFMEFKNKANIVDKESVMVKTIAKCYRNYVIDAENTEEAKKKAHDEYESDFVKYFNDNFVFYVFSIQVHPYEIMNKFNGHDKDLVNKINYIYAKDVEAMKPILLALYKRDVVESDSKGITEHMFNNNFDLFCENFLTHVCDNEDLKTIINFVRYRDEKTNKVLFADGWSN